MAGSLFDKIAPVYNVFFRYQVRSFRTIFSRGRGHLLIPAGARILDIGCGTGALAFCLQEQGYRVTGVDASPKMLAAAKKNNRTNGNQFTVADALSGLPFQDKSFDLVMSSYVAHGIRKEQRRLFFREAQRLARTQVIYQDYNEKRQAMSDIVEWLEGGNYFTFIGHAQEELQEVFSGVKVQSLAAQIAWYICTP